MFFHPAMGPEEGNIICISAGPRPELLALKVELDEKRKQFKGSEIQIAYIAIEKAISKFATGEPKAELLAELESLKSFQSDIQKDRISRLRKR